MTSESLFEEIVEEVLRRLEKRLQQPKRALALFSGGLIALPEALEELKLLQEDGWELIPVLSPAAEKVIGATRVQEALGVPEVFTAGNSPSPTKLLEGIDLVLVPVLTMNTAVKVALGLADTNVTTVISEAIMMGKPIIAACNAADPASPQRRQLGMDKAPAPWLRMLEGYLGRLESFGIQLVDVAELRAAVSGKKRGKALGGSPPPQPAPEAREVTRVVTRADVIRAWEEGRSLVVGQGVIITPLAREVAREYGVELVPEEELNGKG